MPTLIVSAEDDLFKTLPGARFTAEHILDAELHILKSGEHLMVGQGRHVRKWVHRFLRSRTSAARKRGGRTTVPVDPEKERVQA